MHLIICFCGITAGIFQNDFSQLAFCQFHSFSVDLLAEPPGCS